MDDHDLNEHLCLLTARRLGLPSAKSQVMTFGTERVIVVERYDRRSVEGEYRRVHQEDLCQALGRTPSQKYQADGGPSPEEIGRLLQTHVRPMERAAADVATFVDALALNWLIAGTDAHAKNYSVLLANQQVRLAPLYDVASMLSYNEHVPKLKSAMKIGGEYRLGLIASRHWRRVAEGLGLDAEVVLERVAVMTERVPEAVARAAGTPEVVALGSDLPARLVDRVGEWAATCRAALG